MPTLIFKSPKPNCKCDKSNWFVLFGTDDMVQCKNCGTWWQSRARYTLTLPVGSLGKVMENKT